ncbi:hypothetical protein C8F04DRAFT_1247399 [Mycena alexandri]|uniref:Uncharacterized protein n=1 Tax=Mycena alexandri TaxID=1745969 RepID=A0AAD6TLX4_9AGAR|nr:hypothetical protein C8F04DRAFT_1247399 [Mycena alexandri]
MPPCLDRSSSPELAVSPSTLLAAKDVQARYSRPSLSSSFVVADPQNLGHCQALKCPEATSSLATQDLQTAELAVRRGQGLNSRPRCSPSARLKPGSPKTSVEYCQTAQARKASSFKTLKSTPLNASSVKTMKPSSLKSLKSSSPEAPQELKTQDLGEKSLKNLNEAKTSSRKSSNRRLAEDLSGKLFKIQQSRRQNLSGTLLKTLQDLSGTLLKGQAQDGARFKTPQDLSGRLLKDAATASDMLQVQEDCARDATRTARQENDAFEL